MNSFCDDVMIHLQSRTCCMAFPLLGKLSPCPCYKPISGKRYRAGLPDGRQVNRCHDEICNVTDTTAKGDVDNTLKTPELQRCTEVTDFLRMVRLYKAAV